MGQSNATAAAAEVVDRAEETKSQLREAKRSLNKLKEKNGKLQAKIMQLTKAVKERDKLMEKFILNSESEAKVKESCVLQSYKSKVASIERKLEALKKNNA